MIRARRRARSAGSATFEVVLWLPLVMIVGGISFWIHGIFDARIAAMRSSREPAYSDAIGGCGAGSTRDLPSLDGVDFGAVRRLPSVPGGDIVDRALTSTVRRATWTYVAAGLVAVFGVRSREVSVRVVMMCNEPVRDGDPKGTKNVTSTSFDPRSP